ncbi:MAG TPA: YicC/YloC family endoribonuclease [Terriglobia bacterium]|nr:YicC/YloC family endoribonuclease [Terriglobia bacterium]
MIRSMTGYATGRVEEGDFSLGVTLRSINHRFLDLQLRLAVGLESLEPEIRRQIQAQVSRGHLELTVTLERPSSDSLRVDRKVLASYISALESIRAEFSLQAGVDLAGLLRAPGVLAAGEPEIPALQLVKIREALIPLLTETLGRLNEMRRREGAALERDLRARLDKLALEIASAERLSEKVVVLYQRRLERRVRDLIGSAAVDSSRLAQEATLLASRSDIAEEVMRFRTHVEEARRLLEESPEVGKKLDFLLQEMNREANTLLSKTTDVPEVGRAIAAHAIEMKTEVEKLREQAQNIE